MNRKMKERVAKVLDEDMDWVVEVLTDTGGVAYFVTGFDEGWELASAYCQQMEDGKRRAREGSVVLGIGVWRVDPEDGLWGGELDGRHG